MNSVDVKCPICGAMNESLNLEETDGWMECESCGNAVQIMKYVKTRRVPRFQMHDCQVHDVIDIYAPSGQEHNDLELRRY